MKVSPSYPQNDLLFYIKINSLWELHRQKKRRSLRHQIPEHSSIDGLITPTWSIHEAWWSVSDKYHKRKRNYRREAFQKKLPEIKTKDGCFCKRYNNHENPGDSELSISLHGPDAQLLTINNINTTSAKHKTRGNVPLFYPKTHHILHYFWLFVFSVSDLACCCLGGSTDVMELPPTLNVSH